MSTLLPVSHALPGTAVGEPQATPALVTRNPLPGLLALAAMVVALLWTALAVIVQQDADNSRQQALLSLSNLSRAFSEHTAKTLEGADQAVRFVRSEYLAHRQTLDIGSYLATQAIIDSDYHLLTVIGADGYVTHSSQPFKRVDLHEREHFRVHAEGASDRLFISKPVLGKVSGKWSIQITRRINEPDGRFGGVVVVSMPPSYFTRFYQEVDLDRHGVIALVGTDGFVRARASRDGQRQGEDLSNSPLFRSMLERKTGVLQMRSSIDHIDRFWAFRTLDAYGLIVVTGMGVDEALDEFYQRRNTAVFIGVLITLLTFGFTASLYRRAQRQAQLMEALQASQVKAEAANLLKSKFLASVSHELRTPLNGILGYAELIRDTAEDPQAADFGRIIHDSAKHLHSLVNTILDLAKIESGHMVAHLAETELRPLLEETHRLHAVHALGRGLAFTLTIDPACPLQIVTDRTRVLQVLSNVVNNAIKFTERGEVTLNAVPQERELVITVRDTGIGISARRLKGLFTRFQGVADELVHHNQGAGLGLSLAKELTELLGGTLTVQSSLGEGTEVTLRLPLQPHASTPGNASHE